MIEFDLNKAKQRVYVKPTATKKGYYRMQEVGQKEVEKKPSRKDTGKIAALPDEIKKEILDLRGFGDSGAKIKESIEDMIDHGLHIDPETEKKLDVIKAKYDRLYSERSVETNPTKIKELDKKMKIAHDEEREIVHAGKSEISTYVNGKPTGRNFAEEGLIDKDGKLKVTPQALTDWTKVRGVESRKKRKTVKEVETAAKEIEIEQFKVANEKLARVQTENQMLKDQLARERDSHAESDAIREKLRNENYILREKLKSMQPKSL